jgi:hypothetical protein
LKELPDHCRGILNLLESFLAQQLVGDCLNYPGYGAERTFRLRGMRLTLTILDFDLEKPKHMRSGPLIHSFRFKVSVLPDANAIGDYAEPVTFDEPCCKQSKDDLCHSLDCKAPRMRGSLCPEALQKAK